MRWRLLWIVALAVIFDVGGACRRNSVYAADPPVASDDFVVTTFVDGLDDPVAMAVAPDGRVFVTEKAGRIRVVTRGAVLDPPFAEIEVHVDGESGLLGIALDPDYASNRYVYVFASVSSSEQRILRFVDDHNVGSDRTVIFDNIPTGGVFHCGGGLAFGPDGKLYFSNGDNANADAVQDIKSLTGKICRINADGSIPEDNPFRTPTNTPRAVWALGFRNPFRMTFAPDGRLFVFDVGSQGDERREEINLVARGDNCGWPLREGDNPPDDLAGYKPPLVAYTDDGSAITGGVYYAGTQFAEEYRGNVFHLEFVHHQVYRVVLEGDAAVSHEVLLTLEGGPVDMVQSLDGALLVAEHYAGRIVEIRDRNAPPPSDGAPTDVAGENDENPGLSPTVSPAPPLCGLGSGAALSLVASVLLCRRR